MTDFEAQKTNAPTSPTPFEELEHDPPPPTPGVVLAWRPRGGFVADDRAPLRRDLTIGRSSSCVWCIPDKMLSRTHFTLSPTSTGFILRDGGSRNGTRVQGQRIEQPCEVSAGSVIRAGRCLFVVVDDLGRLSGVGERPDGRMAGRFHSAALIRRLRVAGKTRRHILLEGESGSGKELAAQTLHDLNLELGRDGPFRALNVACFAGEDDAVGNLFGVNKAAFTGVDTRVGALELANGGTLFLDEVHNLPLRVQRSLLRFVEDGIAQPLGQTTKHRQLDVRVIIGTNVNVQKACDLGLLAPDLLARLHRVVIPPLRERRSDVPDIFEHLVHENLVQDQAEAIVENLSVSLIERLMLHDYRDGNVRELEDLVAVLGARLEEGESASQTLRTSIEESLEPRAANPVDPESPDVPRSLYERHRAEIIAAYHDVDDNLTELETVLRERGLRCNRRWLADFLDRWGVRRMRRLKRDNRRQKRDNQ